MSKLAFWKQAPKPSCPPTRQKTKIPAIRTPVEGSTRNLRNIRRRIEVLESRQLAEPRKREQIASRAFDALGIHGPAVQERLITALVAERNYRPLTADEAHSMQAYKTQLLEECREAGYNSIEGFEDALRGYGAATLFIRITHRMSPQQMVLLISALRAFKRNRDLSPSESSALDKWLFETDRLMFPLVQPVSVLESRQLAERRKRQQIASRAFDALWIHGSAVQERLITALVAKRNYRPLTADEAHSMQAYKAQLLEECREAGYDSIEAFEDALPSFIAATRFVRSTHRMSPQEMRLFNSALRAFRWDRTLSPSESSALDKWLFEVERLMFPTAQPVSGHSQEDQAQ